MPQMSPILWLNLYIIFTITLVIFIAMFFYMKSPSSAPLSTSKQTNPTMNWKW